MKSNLYDKINQLLERQEELETIVRSGDINDYITPKFAEYFEEYKQNAEDLKTIENKCVITPQTVSRILSRNKNTPYELKIFRETWFDDAKKCEYYTGNFVACYLNSKNKFFNYNKNGVSFENKVSRPGFPIERYYNYRLPFEQYEELISSLDETNSYVLATERLDFVPGVAPSAYLRGINFTKYFTRGYMDNIVDDEFYYVLDVDVASALQTIDADGILRESGKQADMFTE